MYSCSSYVIRDFWRMRLQTGRQRPSRSFTWDDLETSTDLTTQQFKAAVDKFNEADNGYQIEITTSDISNYYIKLNALVAADDMPDVFMCHPGNLMRNAAESGVLMELDDILKRMDGMTPLIRLTLTA